MAQEEVVATESSPAAAAPIPQEVDPNKKAIQEPVSAVTKSGSFKEEADLKKALDELKSILQSAIANGELTVDQVNTTTKPKETAAAEKPAGSLVQDQDDDDDDDDGAKTVQAIECTVVSAVAPADLSADDQQDATTPAEINITTGNDVSIWGVPLLKDERSDAVLVKFLRARDFKPKESLAMLKNTLKWRKGFGIESIMEENLEVPSKMEKVVFMSGVDREGHPVCYNVYGEFKNNELYHAAFGDGEKRQRFLRWRIQCLEKGIRELLDFSPNGVSTMVQVTDLKNSPGPLKRELRQALDLLQDNYPEFVAKQVFINVPWWYIAFNKMIGPFLTQRTKSKFVFAGPSKSAETLFSYISPEQVPVQFGGLSKENDSDFTIADAVIEVNLKPSSKQIIEIPVTQKCLLVWELRVLGWDVSMGARFVPTSEDGYTEITEKSKKLATNDEAYVKNSFKIDEPGKVVITLENATSKKKKLLYRYKARDCTESVCGC